MQAFIYTFMTPVLPLLARKLYAKQKTDQKNLILRYLVYTLLMTTVSVIAMFFLSDSDTSFLVKMDMSPVFILKYLLIELIASVFIIVPDWIYTTKKLAFQIDKKEMESHIFFRIYQKFIQPLWIYFLALFAVIMNVLLLFDDVYWGDEAYSTTLITHNIPDMMQIISLLDSHPPLYYLWLKLWAELLGYSGTVYHFASLLPFLFGIIFAITFFRKKFGKIPAAFFIIMTGLSAPCIEYNVEVRMYSIAFFAVIFCFYHIYRILQANKWQNWIFLSLFTLIGAYSHYYALLDSAILILLVMIFAILKYRRKTWLKALVTCAICIAGYFPWMAILLSAVERTSATFWLETPATLTECSSMLLGGASMKNWILIMTLILIAAFLIIESNFFTLNKTDEKYILQIHAPNTKNWSDEFITMILGLGTIILSIAVSYMACILIRPVLTARYVYPLTGIIIMLLTFGLYRGQVLLKKAKEHFKKHWIYLVGKTVFLLFLLILFVTGIKNYNAYYQEYSAQKTATESTIAAIGDETPNMILVNDGIQHIGWTVLSYYYPNAQIINSPFQTVSAEDYWYFTADLFSTEEIQQLYDNEYTIEAFGEKQLSKYTFMLYHIYK